MKITVFGGTGRIGAELVRLLREGGHETLSASMSTGVDVMCAEHVARALERADVVVDVTAPRARDADALRFHVRSMREVCLAALQAGVRHVVILSAVGADRLVLSDFFLAKLCQESVLRTSKLPFTIVRTAPLFETLYRIVDEETGEDCVINVPPLEMRPAAAADVARVVFEAVTSDALNDVIEVGGPCVENLPELITTILTANEDRRSIQVSADAPYLGAAIGNERLCPSEGRTTEQRFDDWLRGELARDHTGMG